MPRFILAIDQGTTSSRAIIFDGSGSIKAAAQRKLTQNVTRSYAEWSTTSMKSRPPKPKS